MPESNLVRWEDKEYPINSFAFAYRPWKGTITKGPRAQLRKMFSSANVLVVVSNQDEAFDDGWRNHPYGDVAISMNGTAVFTFDELKELSAVVDEARERLT